MFQRAGLREASPTSVPVHRAESFRLRTSVNVFGVRAETGRIVAFMHAQFPTSIPFKNNQGDTVNVVQRPLNADGKGLYKAFTGSMKYFLMKNFLVATGDDPEQDSAAKKATATPLVAASEEG